MLVRSAVLAFFFAHGSFAADADAGRRVVLARGDGNCLLCHAVPGADRPAGTIGPSLAGVGARLSEADIAARIADAARFNAQTVMPPYGRTEGLHDVATQYRGKPLLSERDIADAAAFLARLK
ncbi:MAG: sulfur oxidation c-type cytochrome SoxX [Betaproteobacteria bacterium]